MINRLKFRAFAKKEDGAVAVETAIATPIFLFALFMAVDIGLGVYTLQKMAKSTKSGVQYAVNGGRSEVRLKQIMNSSFGADINSKDIKVAGYCGCISSNSDDNDDDNEGEFEDREPEQGSVTFYTKKPATFESAMCGEPCPDGSDAASLVEVALRHDINGVMKRRTLTTKLQTRFE